MYKYEVEFWDGFSKKYIIEKGLVGFSNIADAARSVQDYYGKSCISKISFFECMDVINSDEIKQKFLDK